MAMRDADFSGLLFGCARPKTALSSNGANDARAQSGRVHSLLLSILSRRSRVTGITEYRVGTAASVRLDVEGLDHLAPLLRFVGDEFPEIGRRA